MVGSTAYPVVIQGGGPSRTSTGLLRETGDTRKADGPLPLLPPERPPPPRAMTGA